jgi:hypothetical protein
MMINLNKPIKDLSNDELLEASNSLNDMHANYLTKHLHPKVKEKFINQPTPEINPAFINLKSEIEAEVIKRNSSNKLKEWK